MKPIEVTDKNFDQIVLQSPKPIAVHFKVKWSRPCRQFAEIIEDVASQKIAPRMNFAEMDLDQNQQTVAKFGITVVPTLMVFNKGQMVERYSALIPRAKLAWELAAALRKIRGETQAPSWPTITEQPLEDDEPQVLTEREVRVAQAVTQACELRLTGKTDEAVALLHAELLTLYSTPSDADEDTADLAAQLVEALKALQG